MFNVNDKIRTLTNHTRTAYDGLPPAAQVGIKTTIAIGVMLSSARVAVEIIDPNHA